MICRLRNSENSMGASTLAHEIHYPSEKFLMECVLENLFAPLDCFRRPAG